MLTCSAVFRVGGMVDCNAVPDDPLLGTPLHPVAPQDWPRRCSWLRFRHGHHVLQRLDLRTVPHSSREQDPQAAWSDYAAWWYFVHRRLAAAGVCQAPCFAASLDVVCSLSVIRKALPLQYSMSSESLNPIVLTSDPRARRHARDAEVGQSSEPGAARVGRNAHAVKAAKGNPIARARYSEFAHHPHPLPGSRSVTHSSSTVRLLQLHHLTTTTPFVNPTTLPNKTTK